MTWLIVIFCLIWLYLYMKAVGASFSPWGFVGFVLSRERIADYLVARAMKAPYTHIYKDGEIYMGRYWLFNPYSKDDDGVEVSKHPWIPFNIRIHRIHREDQDEHLHDHPWNARTFILRGGYTELREDYSGFLIHSKLKTYEVARWAGCTAKLGYGKYHKIKSVWPEGATTLFITGRYLGTWGFMVNGAKVKWRTYLGLDK